MSYRAQWDDDLDAWTVVDHAGVLIRKTPDRATADDVAEAMTLHDAAAALDDRLPAPSTLHCFRL